MPSPTRPILITGCSSGIGKATALRLAKAGHAVIATARNTATLADLEAAGCKIMALDVTDEGSMVEAVKRIEAEYGSVGHLVNNAGYSLSGAIEALSMDALRKQFETNVFGLVRLTQLCLPGMRAQKSGRIINLSSMGGTLVFPGGGAYHATKYAVEAISDALRYEVAGFGIQVVIIQPGLIRTGFAEAVAREMKPPEGPYADFDAHVKKATHDVYEQGPLSRFGGDSDVVAKVIETAITAKRPRTRYAVTPSAWVLMGARRWMSDRAWDSFMASTYPRPS